MRNLSIRSRAPSASSQTVQRIMKANYGSNLKPERLLRSLLHEAGLRFRKDCRPVPAFRCTADIVFPRKRVCVFVDGCFWHGCPQHFACPKTNAEWWAEKINATRNRDERQREHIRSQGWRVIRVWEHEIVKDVGFAQKRIFKALG